MATFISKEELLGAAREVPALMGASPQPINSSPFGGGGTIDQVERILSQINGILTQVNSIRNNPTTRAIIGKPQEAPQDAQFKQITGAQTTGAQPASAPQPQTTAPQAQPKQPEINEEGVKEFIAAVMEELDKNEGVKGITLGQAATAYKMGIQRGELEANAINKLKEWLPKLIK